MNWFYESGGQQQGPVSDSDLERLLAEGKINASTLVWREGQANWQPLQEVRPAGAPALPPGGAIPEGQVQCGNCGRLVPRSEIIQIGARAICAICKPVVLQQIQQGSLPGEFDGLRAGPSWENRTALGIVTAAWQTVLETLTKPTETFERMKREGGLGAPLYYIMLVGGLGSIVGIVYQALLHVITGAASPQMPDGNPLPFPMMAALSGYMYLVLAIFMPLLIAISAFVMSGILHLSLMICGGAKQPFETTFRVYCYAQGSANLLQIIPICGALAGFVWGLVVMCIAMGKTHEISAGKGTLAVLLPYLVCCGGLILLFVSIFGMAFAAAASHTH